MDGFWRFEVDDAKVFELNGWLPEIQGVTEEAGRSIDAERKARAGMLMMKVSKYWNCVFYNCENGMETL